MRRATGVPCAENLGSAGIVRVSTQEGEAMMECIGVQISGRRGVEVEKRGDGGCWEGIVDSSR